MSQIVDRRRPVGDRAAPSSTVEHRRAGPRSWDIAAVRADFPILSERIDGRPLVWLDNAATTQKPRSVIQRLVQFYERGNANIHRSGHTLGTRATSSYEQAREAVRHFLNAPTTESVIFVRGTTEAVNLVAQGWGPTLIGEGDEVVISWLEHSSNIVPWQRLTAARRAHLRVIPVDDRGQISLAGYLRLLTRRTRLVALTHVSNAIGTVLPIGEMIQAAHAVGARVLVDGAQAAAHLPIDVRAIDADFYAFSGHKVLGPTGIGALYVHPSLLNEAGPWQTGGSMVSAVAFDASAYRAAPARFEAGTGHIAGALGLAAALAYLAGLGPERVQAHEQSLAAHAREALRRIDGLTLVGDPSPAIGVLSFVIPGQRPEHVGAMLDRAGIAVRVGDHCAQPVLRRLGHESSIRASLALYNTHDEIDALAASLRTVIATGGTTA